MREFSFCDNGILMFNSDNRYVNLYSENKGKVSFHYDIKEYVNFYSETKGYVECFFTTNNSAEFISDTKG